MISGPHGCMDCAGWEINAKKLETEIKKLDAEIKELNADNKELNDLFQLQYTRMAEATEIWQKATGNHDTFPDLGKLLTWLLKNMKDSND